MATFDNDLEIRRAQLIRLEILRFRIAAFAIVFIGIVSFFFFLYAVLADRQSFKLKWEFLGLFGITALLFALPLFRKVDLRKDGGTVEFGTPLSMIEDAFREQQIRADSARRQGFEQTQQQIGSIAAQLEALVSLLDESRLKPLNLDESNKEKISRSEPTILDLRRSLPEPIQDDDPQKGRFGNNRNSNGRIMTARTSPSAFGSGWLTLTLRVEATNGAPLAGKFVYFFLHDSFDPDIYRKKIDRSGLFAELEVPTYGAFTAGAVADKGETRLEIDLSDSDILAPRYWKER